MSLRILKWRHSETKWSALAAMAQSAYLLSSSSLCINPHSKNVDCKMQLSSDRINFRTLSATSDGVFSAIFSWYSNKISVLTTSSKSPFFKTLNIGRYLDFSGSAISRTLVSRTIPVSKIRYAYAPTAMTRWFARPNDWLPKVGPFPYQSSEQNNRPAFSEYPAIDHRRHYRHTLSAIHFEDCSNASGRCVKWP